MIVCGPAAKAAQQEVEALKAVAGDIEIVMQATGAPGWHFSDLYPAIYKGSERRPNNYRLPQLTAVDDHPGEDLPIFRFAFEIVSQSAAPTR